MNACTQNKSEWLTIGEAAELINTSATIIRRLARRGAVAVRRLPGTHPTVERESILRVAASSTQPAVD